MLDEVRNPGPFDLIYVNIDTTVVRSKAYLIVRLVLQLFRRDFLRHRDVVSRAGILKLLCILILLGFCDLKVQSEWKKREVAAAYLYRSKVMLAQEPLPLAFQLVLVPHAKQLHLCLNKPSPQFFSK